MSKILLALAASSALALAAATPALAIHNGWDPNLGQSGWQHQRLQCQSQSRMHHRHR